MTLSEAARQLQVAELTLKRAIARGALKAVQPLANGPWIVDKKELEGLEPRVRARASLEKDAAHRRQQMALDIPKT